MSSIPTPAMRDRQRSLFAEFLGTFFLVFFGVGAAVFVVGHHTGFLGVAMAFGLAQLVMVYAIGPVSGCHINPAVTLGQLLAGRITPGTAIRYWLAQFAGGLVAGVVLNAVAGSGPLRRRWVQTMGLGAQGWGPNSPSSLMNPHTGQVIDGYGLGPTVVVEILLTGIFVFVVLASTDVLAHTRFAGIAIGLTLLAMHLVAIPVDNASFNPARSLAVAPYQNGALGQVWAFIVFPLAGGILGAAAYTLLYGRNVERKPANAQPSG